MTRLTRIFALLSLAVVVTSATACGRSDLLAYDQALYSDGGADSGDASTRPHPDGSHHPDATHTGCTSSDACAATPATPYCELPQGVCVACLTNPDTCPTGEACDPTTHTCVGIVQGCTSNAQCPMTKPVCDIMTGECVGCTLSAQCPTGDICKDFQCVPSCAGGAVCGEGLACCGGGCIDEGTDPDDCGSCGRACPGTEACIGGACQPAGGCATNGCAGADTCCGNTCVNTGVDPNHCGTCTTVCPAGDSCATGSCQAPVSCNGGPVCTGGDQCCGTGCVDTTSDPSHCGGCNTVCKANEQCTAGQCVSTSTGCFGGPPCTGIDQCCGTGCTDVSTDPQNCSECGFGCPKGDTCVGGNCTAPASCDGGPVCMGKDQCCGTGCTDIDTDPNNCGGCKKPCPPGDTCVAATCTAPASCNGGPVCTGVDQCCKSGCTNIDTDPNNCGGCNAPCANGSTCVGGICSPAATCDGQPACTGVDQCCPSGCTDLNTDPQNCGGCARPCPKGDTCVSATCTAPASCNGGPVCTGVNQCCPSGCADIDTDPLNCGGCSRPCPTGDTCVAAQCTAPASCLGGPVCINKEQCCSDGCTDVDTDPENCGGCNRPCPMGDSCVSGQCTAPMSCNGGPVCTGVDQCCSSGCVNIDTDPANCGGCNRPCPPPGTCVGGGCMVMSCQGQFCPPGDKCCSTGCSNTATDPANCGGCNMPCKPGQSCVDSMCTGLCENCGDAGEDSAVDSGEDSGEDSGLCLGGPACTGSLQCCDDGCTDTTTDPQNCGGCNKPCPPGDSCAGSMCQFPESCNGGPICVGAEKCCPSGCVNTTNDPNNCNGCGVVCAPGDTCVASTCTPPTTACNGGPACTGVDTCCSAGCVNTATDPNNCSGCDMPCPMVGDTCVASMCVNNEGVFNPTVNPTFLSPGPHAYTSINIPAGITVYVAGAGVMSGTLSLSATGAIEIDGTIDLSGGPGTQNTITSQSTESGSAGAGGFTGEPYQSAAASAPCSFVAGNGGSLGDAIAGTVGTCFQASTTTCISQTDQNALVFAAPPAMYGGGGGVFTGFRAYGAGGGGPAGGAPGALGAPFPEEADCTGASGGGGAVGGAGGAAPGVYAGSAGIVGQTQCPEVPEAGVPDVPPAWVGGGGGGSIGAAAAADLAVASTFQTGSSGGGGSADYLDRPVFGGTSGGGGGGGALMLSSTTSINITGQVLANGGAGGDAVIGIGEDADCNPQPGAAGGGGSGGVIYLQAPIVMVAGGATVSAAGGNGGAESEFATGGGGGGGGLGRIRLSVTAPTCSTLSGSFTPALPSGCSAGAAQAGTTYIGTYPN